MEYFVTLSFRKHYMGFGSDSQYSTVVVFNQRTSSPAKEAIALAEAEVYKKFSSDETTISNIELKEISKL